MGDLKGAAVGAQLDDDGAKGALDGLFSFLEGMSSSLEGILDGLFSFLEGMSSPLEGVFVSDFDGVWQTGAAVGASVEHCRFLKSDVADAITMDATSKSVAGDFIVRNTGDLW